MKLNIQGFIEVYAHASHPKLHINPNSCCSPTTLKQTALLVCVHECPYNFSHHPNVNPKPFPKSDPNSSPEPNRGLTIGPILPLDVKPDFPP